MVMDTLKKDHEEMHQRLVSLQNEKDKVNCVRVRVCVHVSFYLVQLSSEYREKKKLTDNLKEDLQIKINEYTKFAEQGEYICVLLESFTIDCIGSHDKQDAKARVAVIHNIKDQLKQQNELVKQLKKGLKEIQDKIKAEKEVCKRIESVCMYYGALYLGCKDPQLFITDQCRTANYSRG